MKHLLSLLALCSFAHADVVTEPFLDRVAMVESGFNFKARGDSGRSLGAYQLSEGAWTDALNWGKFNSKEGQPFQHLWVNLEGRWKQEASNPTYSRIVCKAYFQLLQHRFTKQGINTPTQMQLYMAYNMGFGRASQFGFNPSSIALPAAVFWNLRKADLTFSK